MLNRRMRGFGTILFDMVPKGVGYTGMPKFRFGTVRFITTLNTFSVFIFIKIWHTIIMNKVD